MWRGFDWLIRHYPVQAAHLNDMLDGQRMDLTQIRYATFEQLHGYCYRVASTVGLVCLSVWGAGGNPRAAQLAEHRGIALQLTNILRDLVEDARRNRLYLPQDDLTRFGVEPETFIAQLQQGRADQAFDAMMRFQIQRARSYYEQSAGLEELLESPCRPTCWAMMRIYECLLEKIATDPRSVLRRRVRLSSIHKLGIALRASYRRSMGT